MSSQPRVELEIPEEPPPTSPREGRARRVVTVLLRILLPLAVLAAGGAVALHFMETAPVAKKRKPERRATLVEVEPVRFTAERARVEAMGSVTPARTVELRPRVSGEVVEMSSELAPGGVFRAGETMLRVDPADYELAIRELESDVARAEADLKLEFGNQSIAKKEYELLGEIIREEDRELVLRKPQLASVRASLEKTRTALAKAKLNLERTVIRAPFNAVVQSREVNVGTQVTEAATLATLVGTDAYWVETAVSVDDLQWIRIPRTGSEKGSAARVYDPVASGNGAHRVGRVIRLAADLEEQGRMARVLVAVDDPMGLKPANSARPQLLLGSYVRVEIEGSELRSVAALDRPLLRDGDTVWIMDSEGKLDIRPVKIAFRERERVLLSAGLEGGENLVVTDLSAPVQGMPLRTEIGGEDSAKGPAETRDSAPKAPQGKTNP